MHIKIFARAINSSSASEVEVETGYDLVHSYEISRNRDDVQKEEIIELDENGVLGIELEDGGIWFAAEEDLGDLFDLGTNRGLSEQTPFLFPDSIVDKTDRSVGYLFIKIIHFFKRKKEAITENAALKIAAKMEANIKEGLKRINRSFRITPYQDSHLPLNVEQPILLFIHGTSSSTLGSFGELANTETWNHLLERYQQNILAFDHKTWTKSPLQNALEIIEQLPEKATLHIIGYSRGGLVGDILSRCAAPKKKQRFQTKDKNLFKELGREGEAKLLGQLNKVASSKKIRIERFIRVGCPANGTTILSDRLDHFLNVLLNLIPKVGNPLVDFPIKALRSLVIQTVGERNDPTVLPGIEAMMPDSPLLKILNNPKNHTEINYQGDRKKPTYRFLSTPDGDGSVTWGMGIPFQLPAENIFYVATDHDYLANEAIHFDAFFEILEKGQTASLSNRPLPVDRSSIEENDHSEVISNEPAELISRVLGLRRNKYYPKIQEEVTIPTLKVTMINGDLKYNNLPILIGHFEGDGIVSAESVMDLMLDEKLSERRNLEIYPGPIGTNLIYQKKTNTKLGAIIVGLGKPENLTSLLLSKTIEKACLAYLSSQENNKEGYHLSSLLIGSGYANLSIANSIQSILEGVIRANKKMKVQYPDKSLVEEFSFIELYEGKAITAFSVLHRLQGTTKLNFELEGGLKHKSGKRRQMPIDEQETWWKRFSIRVKKENGQEKIYITSSTGRAGVGEDSLPINLATIEKLLKDRHRDNVWDIESTRTVFELIMPNHLKISLKDQPKIIWVLDKMTAVYPWELFQYDEVNKRPYCTQVGMIRQLSTNYLTNKINPVLSATALVIGDPKLDKAHQQLPAAKEEAERVNQQLRNSGYTTNLLINEYGTTVINSLFNEYKVIHIASHGVLEHGPNKETGVLLSNGLIITPHMINQRTSTPDLVFINCCHLGRISNMDEEVTRNRSQLAANIGTQLIENGVKAVVVAGWAVNDAAAKIFAEVFYEEMLHGQSFGDAVLTARRNCYDAYPQNNTWGAYQCYGDPFYQLQKKRENVHPERLYILEKQALIDLEILLNKTDSGLSRDNEENLEGNFHELADRISRSAIQRTPAIIEAEALICINLDLLKVAIEKYEELFKQEKALYQVKGIEKYCNILMKYYVKENKLDADVDAVIQKLQGLQNLAFTSERSSLIGSAYKRKSILIKKGWRPPTKNRAPQTNRSAVEHMTRFYKKATLFKVQKKEKDYTLKDLLKQDVYALTNWLIGERLLLEQIRTKKSKEKKKKEIAKALRSTSIVAFLKEKQDSLKQKGNDQKIFWDWVADVNINQCFLLYCDSTGYSQVIQRIEKDYQEVRKRGGSEENLESEITQMEFIANNLSSKKSEQLRQAVKTLTASFQELREN